VAGTGSWTVYRELRCAKFRVGAPGSALHLALMFEGRGEGGAEASEMVRIDSLGIELL
jgi:hypothetical protein